MRETKFICSACKTIYIIDLDDIYNEFLQVTCSCCRKKGIVVVLERLNDIEPAKQEDEYDRLNRDIIKERWRTMYAWYKKTKEQKK